VPVNKAVVLGIPYCFDVNLIEHVKVLRCQVR